MALTEMDNVQLKVYNPINPLKPWTAMGRMHDKYLIADRTAYILGGRNCFDYFLGDHNGYKNYDWDFLVYCAESKSPDSLNQLIDYFNAIWEQKTAVFQVKDEYLRNIIPYPNHGLSLKKYTIIC